MTCFVDCVYANVDCFFVVDPRINSQCLTVEPYEKQKKRLENVFHPTSLSTQTETHIQYKHPKAFAFSDTTSHMMSPAYQVCLITTALYLAFRLLTAPSYKE